MGIPTFLSRKLGFTWKELKLTIFALLSLVAPAIVTGLVFLLKHFNAPRLAFIDLRVIFVLAYLPSLWLCYSVLYGCPPALSILYARVFFEFLLNRPSLLSRLRPQGIDWFDAHHDDMSAKFTEREAQRCAAELRHLRSFSSKKLQGQDRVSKDVFDFFLLDQLELDFSPEFRYHNYVVNQLFGVQNEIREFMCNKHTMTEPAHCWSYLQRLKGMATVLDQLVAALNLRQKKGIAAPRFMIRAVSTEMKKFIAIPAEECVLYTMYVKQLNDKSTKLGKSLSDSLSSTLAAKCLALVKSVVYPGYGRLVECCDNLMRELTSEAHGVWNLPNGEEYYRLCLRHHTTTDMTADQIHEMGLRETKRIQTEIREILKSQGLNHTDFRAAIEELCREPAHLYLTPEAAAAAKKRGKSAKGEGKGESKEEKPLMTPEQEAKARADIIHDYESIIQDIDSKMDRLFNVRPAQKCKVERMPTFREPGAPGAYYWPPALDGSKPGTFYCNLRDLKETVKWKMRTLAYHEAVPGHHFQLSIAQGLKSLPFFRRVVPFTAYVEGWGLYSEQLAAENGYQDNPFDRLGYLDAQIMRAVRLVVDTGIHHKRWSREQAIEYMTKNTLMGESEVVTEIERYFVMPGQACAYMVGMLKLLELRDKAKKAKGASFDIREFHDVVLLSGPLPLVLLESVVDDWLRTGKRL